jgi:NAD(P)-dependent dehydrogenase (short-subunit alcohol dehydrogenase family)
LGGVSAPWTADLIGDLDGSIAVVTGANSGLGYRIALELARHRAHVVLACRDPERGDEALGQLRVAAPGSSVELRLLDLADLASVRAFAAGFDGGRLDLLVNNAGIMAVSHGTTADGFERQFGVNHLGHFALTGLLAPALLAGSLRGGPSRVVTQSSLMYRFGTLHRDDLMGERRYSRWRAYNQSKLANLLFTRELAGRLGAAGVPVIALASHPGYAATNLQLVAPREDGNAVMRRMMAMNNRVFAQSAADGALPALRAATDPQAGNGDFYGPGGLGESRGAPRLVHAGGNARNDDDAGWLWRRSVKLTGVDYGALAAANA